MSEELIEKLMASVDLEDVIEKAIKAAKFRLPKTEKQWKVVPITIVGKACRCGVHSPELLEVMMGWDSQNRKVQEMLFVTWYAFLILGGRIPLEEFFKRYQ